MVADNINNRVKPTFIEADLDNNGAVSYQGEGHIMWVYTSS